MQRGLKVAISGVGVGISVLYQVLDLKKGPVLDGLKERFVDLFLLDPLLDVSNRVLVLFDYPVHVRGVE